MSAEADPTRLYVLGVTALTARCVDLVRTTGCAQLQAVVAPSAAQPDVDPALVRAAEAAGVPVIAVDDLDGPVEAAAVAIGYPRILPQRTLDLFASGVMNLHLAPLPWYRGALTSLSFAVLRGEDEFGVTLHRMDAGIDTGDVLARRDFPLPHDRTVAQLMPLLLDEAYELFREAFPRALAGEITATPQALWPGYEQSRSVLYTRDALDGMQELASLDDVELVDRTVRALSWRPGSEPYVRAANGNRLVVTLGQDDGPAADG
ncbi:formyltransferase family protein [Cellulomonas sp. S1-8]|uniref:formyltransferase family protein n=1 Tax=Cellulomonas sp. S1-8 TaxID=2904790 RepID=UPI0022434C2A|nr:formyltransferase family protein [Cellulomonas sp. S1-8]UZN02964.1 formyltransferase family protein [Cellulomonas sp. S1-8]